MALFLCLNLMFFYSSGEKTCHGRAQKFGLLFWTVQVLSLYSLFYFSIQQFNLDLSKQKQVQRSTFIVQTFAQNKL